MPYDLQQADVPCARASDRLPPSVRLMCFSCHTSSSPGAAQLQSQLGVLQQQLAASSQAFAAEHAALMDGLEAAEGQRDEACAAAAAAASELEVLRGRLAEAEAAQARTMADLQVGRLLRCIPRFFMCRQGHS